MSKAAKQSIIILIVLLLAAFGFAGITLSEKLALEKKAESLQKQVAEYQGRERKQLQENKKLKDKTTAAEKAKTEIEARLSTVDDEMAVLNDEIGTLKEERDRWQKRVDSLRTERDTLLVKLQDQPTYVPPPVVKPEPKPEPEGEPESEPIDEYVSPYEQQEAPATVYKAPPRVDDDSYWAQILKEKATLELELEQMKQNISNSSMEVVELRKKNSDLQLELSQLQRDRDVIEREIKYGKDLADNLSLQLARTNSDKKFLNERVDNLNGENTTLRDQIKRLTTTKIALEKSIVRLQGEKKHIEKRLLETENVIQNRIDEIWQIKESLEKNFKPYQAAGEAGNEVELPPIVVSAQGEVAQVSADSDLAKGPGFDGNIVSINDDNNFVIVDIGERSGLQIGDILNVYRGADYVAALEVIQVRKDISAADIKNKVAKIQVGDIVR